MRTFDFGQVVKNIDGTDLMRNDKALTMRDVIEEALLSDFTPEARPNMPIQPNAATKAARFKLWRKMSKKDGNLIELTGDDENTIKEAAPAWPTNVYGQIMEMIEGPGYVPPPPMPEPTPIAAAVKDAIPTPQS